MKRRIKSLFLAFAVLVSSIPMTMSVVAEDTLPTYNAYDEFSIADNPNGVWSYQYLNNGTYTNMTYDAESGVWSGGSATIQAITNGGPAENKALLAMRAENVENNPVLTFTAEHAGTVNISMESGGVYAPYASQSEVSFSFYHNSTEMIASTDVYFATTNVFTTAIELEVKAGDKLYFSAQRTGWRSNPTIHLNPQITYTAVEETLPIYNALEDFDLTATNPNGVWTYQYRLTTAPDDYINLTATDTAWGTGSATGYISDNTTSLKVYPANPTTDVVLMFTAPYGGVININMTNGKVSAPAANSVRFTTMHNGVTITDYSIDTLLYSNNSFFTGTCTLNVEAGDIIRFVIGVNGWNGNQQTYFNPQIEYTTVDDMEGIPISVESLNDIEAVKGTQAENLNLPQTVNVRYSDTTIKQVGINWDTSNYSPEIGKYVLTGTLDVEKNPKELSVTIDVEVKAEGAVYETYKVWKYGELDGIMTYHQFGLFTTSKGILLATAEARVSVEDLGAHHIVLKRSSDGGKTWGDTIIVANYNDTINEATNICYSDANVVEDSKNGKLFLFYTANFGDTSILYYKVSTDDGATWGEAVDVSSLFADDPYARTLHRTGAGHGLQIQNGQYAGRLLIYINHGNKGTTVAEKKQGISVIYSDNGGETWGNSAYTEPIGLSEGRIAELEDGTLVINSRNPARGSTSENYRYQLVSTDGGATWSTPKAWKSLGKMYGCDASLYTDIQEGFTRMLFSSIEMNNPVRNNLQIRLSYDAGATWSYQKELWRDNSITGGNGDQNSDITKAGTGASDISKISDSTYGVLHGTTVVNNDVEIVIFNLAWLTDGADESSDINGVQSLKTEFNGYDDFSAEYNPNLPWKYQYRVLENGSYVYYNLQDSATSDTADEKITGQWKTSGVGTISKTQGDMVFSSTCNVLGLAPTQNNDDIVLTFVAPYSGEICISTENIAVFAPYQSSDGVSFSLLHNEKEIVAVSDLDTDYNTAGNRFFTGTEMLTVEAGDVIRFVVGRNGDVTGTTYFNPDIVYTKIDMQGMNLDVNADREINSKDAEELRKILVTASDVTFFDVNGDDVCNVIDLVSLKKYLAKIS